jgi:hypothetical protein
VKEPLETAANLVLLQIGVQRYRSKASSCKSVGAVFKDFLKDQTSSVAEEMWW